MAKRIPALDADRSDVPYIDVECGGVQRRILIKRMASARRLTLRVRSVKRDVVLTLPLRVPLTRARVFAERHAGWIEARLGKLPEPATLRPGLLLPIRGVPHRIEHRPCERGPVWTEAGGAFDEAPRLCVSGDASFLARRIRDYLVQQARGDLGAAVERHCAALGVRATRLTLRDTSSRWGSCSSSGALSFSWRLIMAPPAVLDYLAAHEVAHLVEMNHSPAFWAVTERLAPGYKTAEAWLKTHGSTLMRIGVSTGQP